MKQRIAFFDFDGTITFKDTYLEFIKYTKGTLRFITGFFINSPYLVAYKLKIIPNQVAKEKVLGYYFKNVSLTEFQKLCDDFATEVVPKLIRAKALAEIKTLQKDGTTVVIVSASFGNWIQKWANENEIELIATRAEVVAGRITGCVDGKNCHGQEKVRRISEVYNLADYEEVYAYGDTSGDLPMLRIATNSFFKPFR